MQPVISQGTPGTAILFTSNIIILRDNMGTVELWKLNSNWLDFLYLLGVSSSSLKMIVLHILESSTKIIILLYD